MAWRCMRSSFWPTAVQEVFNYPVLNAGFILTPRAIISAFLLWFLTKMYASYFNDRWSIIIGLIFSIIGCYQMSRYSLITDAIGFILSGYDNGSRDGCLSRLSVITFETIEEKILSDATGLFNLMRTMGGSVGCRFVVVI